MRSFEVLMRMAFACAMASSVALPLIACGPAMRTVVEGDMRFEHCYRIDEDPRVPAEQKRQCWDDWNHHFTRGQDRTRIEYARARSTTLALAPTLGEPPAPAIACPPPISPYAPPPATVGTSASSFGDRNDAFSRCGDDCARNWRMCGAACTGVAECGTTCDDRYRGCMKSCM